jgi:DNA-binding MarR family transcriptional regulator
VAPTHLNKVANSVHSVALRLLRKIRQVDVAIGLSGPRASMLSVLVFAGPMAISKLAAIEQVSGPAVTKLVDGLAADGLARRVRSSDDRRVVLVEATSAGNRRLEAGRARRVVAMAGLLQDLDRDELRDVETAFRHLAKLLS